MTKKNIKKLQEQLKKLQVQMRETETAFFAEVGRATLKWIQGEKNIAELEKKILNIKANFGKE
jgi:predicted  nucleic acid-binding Zn-ribbon protein